MKANKEILKQAKITGVKSYKVLYGTSSKIFAKVSHGQPDSAWYCKIKDNGIIEINTKYFDYPKSVKDYNNKLK